jgi:hypothetical protein
MNRFFRDALVSSSETNSGNFADVENETARFRLGRCNIQVLAGAGYRPARAQIAVY